MKKQITFEQIEQEATHSDLSLTDFTQAVWNWLFYNPAESRRIGKSLRVINPDNFGNVFHAILYRLVGNVYPEQFVKL